MSIKKEISGKKKAFKDAASMAKEQAAKLEGMQDKAQRAATKAGHQASQAKGLVEKQAAKVAKATKANAFVAKASAKLAEHTVASGDTLSGIASQYYGAGDKEKWMAIYEANKKMIGDNPSAIKVGQTLIIPKI